jgi:hypothetical protein
MLEQTSLRVYMSVSDSIAGIFEDELKRLVTRGIKVVIITGKPYSLDGAVVYHASKPGRQIRLITDSRKVLTGDLENGKESTCLYSGKRNLVDVFKESLKNEIKLIEINENT